MNQFRLLALLACWAVSRLCAQPADAPVLPLVELQPGMKGEVWTVFKGRDPEPFAVQVTGILRNALGPGKSMILCELTDPRVQGMGAVAGMSGSPLYIERQARRRALLPDPALRDRALRRFHPDQRHAGNQHAARRARTAFAPTPIPIKGERQGARSSDGLGASDSAR